MTRVCTNDCVVKIDLVVKGFYEQNPMRPVPYTPTLDILVRKQRALKAVLFTLKHPGRSYRFLRSIDLCRHADSWSISCKEVHKYKVYCCVHAVVDRLVELDIKYRVPATMSINSAGAIVKYFC